MEPGTLSGCRKTPVTADFGKWTPETDCGETGACVEHRGRAALQGRESRSEISAGFSRCGNDLSRRRVFPQPVKGVPFPRGKLLS